MEIKREDIIHLAELSDFSLSEAEITSLGKDLENKYNIKWLYSDFKKADGYKNSIQLSKKYNLYRQDYCGCIYSQRKRILD